MRSVCPVVVAAMLLVPGVPAAAQIAPANATGVAMGQLQYRVKDVEAVTRFWTSLGGRAITWGKNDRGVALPGVLLRLTVGAASGGSDGSVVNHVAFRVPSFTALEAAGLTVQRLQGFPGVGFVMAPEGERIELFEDSATNLTFTPDSGAPDANAQRHARPVPPPIAFHHLHLYLPDGAVADAKAWYTRLFGGTPGKRSNYDAIDLPGVNINLGVAPKPVVPTAGRAIDRIGFEVTNLEAFCTRLSSMGIAFTVPYGRDEVGGYQRATLLDPWGTTIELTEGLRRF